MPLPVCGTGKEEPLGNCLVFHPCPGFVVALKFGIGAPGPCEEGTLPSCPLSHGDFGEEPKPLGVVPWFEFDQEIGVVPKAPVATLPYPGFDVSVNGVFQLDPGLGVLS